MTKPISVLADWIPYLPLQQQAVLILALRGPDGDPKHTSFKPLLRAYRGCVLKAAKIGRSLNIGETAGDTFMQLDLFENFDLWNDSIKMFLEDDADAAVLHHYTHFMHGAEVLAYKHPDVSFRLRWFTCYHLFVERLHLSTELEKEMDRRLSDWERKHWEEAND